MSLVEHKKPTILIVDDDKANIDILLNILVDYDVIPCLNGKTAIELATKEEIDLILLDIVMPDMNGFEVCSILKINLETANIPIMFLSSKRDMDDINRGFELGAIDYLTKPFNPLELKHHIKTHLQLKSYQQSLETKNKELNLLNQKIKDAAKQSMRDMCLDYQYGAGEDVDFGDFDNIIDNVNLEEK